MKLLQFRNAKHSGCANLRKKSEACQWQMCMFAAMAHIAVNTRLLLSDRLEGISRFAFEVLKRLVRDHPEVEFSFFFDRQYHSRFLLGENVRPYVIPPQSRHPLLWYIWFHQMLPRKLNKLKPDVFFSPEFYLTSHPSIPQIPVFHDLAYEHYPEDLGKLAAWYCRRYSPIYAKKASELITVSTFSKRDIARLYNIESDKISVVYNGADPSFHPISEAEQQKVRDKYSHGKPYFHFVGTLNPRKNIESLLQAFDKFKGIAPNDVQLLIVGRKGWQYNEAMQTYEAMQYKEAVRFTGFVEDEVLKQIYGASLGLTYVPYLEGFGIPLIEAMQTEVPIICSDRTAMPEVVGNAAILVDPFDTDEIAAAMQDLYTNKGLRNSLIEHGRRRREIFSWDLTAEKVWEVLEKYL